MDATRIATAALVASTMLFQGCSRTPDCNAEGTATPRGRAVALTGPAAAYAFLAREQDRFHTGLIVYDDRDSGGAHFFPSGWMGDLTTVPEGQGKGIIDDASTENPRSGDTCVKISVSRELLKRGTQGWMGVYWQFPDGNWGRSAGLDLGRYSVPAEPVRLTFWARGSTGKELVQFLSGGVQRYADSRNPELRHRDTFGPSYPEGSMKEGLVKLSTEWRRYRIELNGEDLRNLIGAFAWVVENEVNRDGLTFFIDDVSLVFGKTGTARRLSEPRFTRSYVPRGTGEEDRYVRNVCYAYDNALLLLAYLARGNDDDKRRAKLVADAFVLAVERDRAIADGRLRNGYSTDDLLDRVKGTARLPGWWDDRSVPGPAEWREDPYTVSSDCGNMAWAMLALLGYWERVDPRPDSVYLRAATRMAEWIERNCRSDGDGYRGGLEGWPEEPEKSAQVPSPWKSTEHNIDLFVAFRRLHAATGDPKWSAASSHALRFVERMWNAEAGHFWTGTQPGTELPNPKPIPLDIHPWVIMALRDRTYARGIDWALSHCGINHPPEAPQAQGFDFKNDQRDPRDPRGIWWEGTAQMQVAFRLLGDARHADRYLASLRAFGSPPDAGGGIVATSTDQLWTGFLKNERQDDEYRWMYYRRPHVGATSWYLFAELGWNPYWSEPVTPLPAESKADTDQPGGRTP